ncbi:aromatic ring-hydroxylating oxygenase subunit alpha [Raineyella sp. W15-4]|uniref:aromatic ring-hydroxylating oxygenase subunit alpha n=1 Tax=Raineyella sp. W15-4 TaxID=3081651 RepID=UPI0029547B6B|nr:Rieske 2Fe-2S domain-containing protein [Raineyella sp. W15-4]WOQ18280.1 Rieske 2Fe-2S domain-containing protein [Raineyella sp. W15-4]
MHRYQSPSPDDAAYIDAVVDRVEASLDESLLPVDIFNDDRIFAAEMQRIFTKNWVFMGHESEIPNKGDFVMRRIGVDRVILVRDSTGTIRVLNNHCRHRGTEICHEDSGNTSVFKCPYHGWAYKNDGDWAGAPLMKDAYGEKLDARDWGLLRAPKVETLFGFVFASLSEDVPPLREALGDAVWAFEAIFNLHEDGVEVLGPPEVFTVKADWKNGAENFAGDAYHVGTTHYSNTLDGFIPGLNNVAVAAHGYDFGNGNSFIGHSIHELIAPPFTLWGYPEEVRSQFQFDRLDDVQREMIENRPPTIGTIFPNLSYLRFPQPYKENEWPIPFTNIRVWQPVAPGVMELWTWEFEYTCAPQEYKDKAYLAGQYGFGSGGVFEQDDTVVWEGIAKAGKSSWAREAGMRLHLRQKRNGPDPEWQGPGRYYESILGEYLQEEFYRRWVKEMRSHKTTQPAEIRAAGIAAGGAETVGTTASTETALAAIAETEKKQGALA